MPPTVRAMLPAGLFTALHTVTAALGPWSEIAGTGVAMVWPAAGVAALWLLLRPGRVLDPVLLVATGAAVHVLVGGFPLPAALGLAVVELGQALLVVAVRHRLATPRAGAGPLLADARDLVALLVAAGVGAAGGALAGSVVLDLAGTPWSPGGALVWQARSATAVLVVVALGLRVRQLLRQRRAPLPPGLLTFRVPRRWRLAELALAVVASVLGNLTVFWWMPGYPVAFPLFALTAWVALRFDTGLTALRTVAVSTVAVLMTAAGHGPFAAIPDPVAQAGIVQAYVALGAALGLALALNRDERLVLVDRLREAVEYSEERHRQVRVLADATRSVLMADDPRHAVCAAVREAVGADGAYLMEPDGEGRLVSTAVVGLDLPPLRFPADPALSLTARIFADGLPRFVTDAAAEPGVHQQFVGDLGVVSAAWQPAAISGGRVVAVIAVMWRTPVEAFCDTTRGVLTVLGGEAARAIERGNLLEQLARAADRDQLTGLANRRRWDELSVVEVSRAQRHAAPLTFLLLDLDHFKVFNDTRGHQAGDVLLQEFAAAASGCLREGDLIARWGGEEFAVALPDCPASEALVVAQRIIAAVPGGQTATVGVAQWVPGETVGEALGRADAALYEGKHAGRARAVLAGQPLPV
ncbi:hypothetical protein GCM10011381_03480 [Klenkia taihuensis]|nr:hypothetical protein GCM10011381_03480 [Klenkia taihuensis]